MENQCDGCRRKLPLEGGAHVNAEHKIEMLCTASRYKEVPYFCPHCGHKGLLDEGAGVVADFVWGDDPRAKLTRWKSADGSLYRCLNKECGYSVIVIP